MIATKLQLTLIEYHNIDSSFLDIRTKINALR